MKIMISQPMKGKTTEQVRDERSAVVARLESQGHTVIDTIFKSSPPNVDNMALWCLGKSLCAMSHVDAVYFMKGWYEARGCLIEHMAAEKYGLWILHQEA